jgi:hypothetical protein
MTNSQNREWVESALRFWINRKPDRHASRKLIAWNVGQLTKMLERLA